MKDNELLKEINELRQRVGMLEKDKPKGAGRKVHIIIGLLASFLIGSIILYAAQITKPYTFTSGATTSASEVNSNFDTLYTKVNALDTLHDSVIVYNDAVISLDTATYQDIAFNSEYFDSDDIHDTSTNNTRLTAKSNGVYLITGTAGFSANTTANRELTIMKNGSDNIGFHRRSYNSSSAAFVTITTIAKLNVDDYIELQAYQNSGSTLNILTGVRFSMVKLSDVD